MSTARLAHLEVLGAAGERFHRHEAAPGSLHTQQGGHAVHDAVVPAQAAAHGAGQWVRAGIAEVSHAQACGVGFGPCARLAS